MANYNATARSNYFAVKDELTFRQWAEFVGLKVLEPDDRDKPSDGLQRFSITPDDGDDCGWPTHRFNEETQDDDDVDVSGELAAYLKDGEVAVLLEVGNEKLRYLCGYSSAVNSAGESVSLSERGSGHPHPATGGWEKTHRLPCRQGVDRTLWCPAGSVGNPEYGQVP